MTEHPSQRMDQRDEKGSPTADLPSQLRETEKVRDEVRSLLDFAVSQAVVSIPDEVIAEALKVLEHAAPWTIDKKVDLWKVRNKLSSVIKPATADSLRAISALTVDQETRPTFFRQWWRDPLARSQAFFAIAWVIAALVILVPAQFYALSITNVLANIEQAQKDWPDALAQVARLETQIGADAPNAQTLMRERDAWDAIARGNEAAIESGYRLLDHLGFVFSWVVPRGPEGEVDQVSLRNVSLVFLKGFGLYFLPLLYGLFGANVYILRQLIVKLDTWSLNSISVTKHHLRRVLGAILGATVGLLFEDNNDAIASIGFGLATLAFLAGYSSELVFSLLDAFITKLKLAFAPAKTYEPEPSLPQKPANQ